METKQGSSMIKRIDQYLLKNKPVTWSTRIHTAGLYVLGFALLLALISFIAPNDPRNKSIIHYWIVLVSILSLLAFIFWMIYLLRFNVFKRFGTWKSTDTLKTFILYFIIIVIILSWPFIPPVVESIRANSAYTDEEIINDVNSMNIKLCQLEQDDIKKQFTADTLEIDTSEVDFFQNSHGDDEVITEPVKVSDRDNYFLVDTATLRVRLFNADSVRKLTDSIYIIYTCPNYKFVYDYEFDRYSDHKLLSSMDLYKQVLQHKQVVDKEKLKSELGKLFTKYSAAHDPGTLSAGKSSFGNYEHSYFARIMDKYDLYLLNRQIENVINKKYRWEGDTIQVSWRLVYYFGLCLAMLVLIYRHTTRRTFFLSLLSAVVLSMLTGLFIAISPYDNNSFFIWTIAYFILFTVLAAFIFNSKYRNVVSGVGLNLLVFMTPFMPLIITSYYYKSLQDRYSHSEYSEYAHLFENQRLHIFLSEIGGGMLLILLLATLYQMAYKKWFALPEQ